MTFNFSEIASVLVAYYDMHYETAFLAPKRIVYYAPPDCSGLYLSQCAGATSTALNEVTVFSNSPEFIQVFIGPRGYTLQQLQQQLGMIATVRNYDGHSAIRVYGGHYACYSARLVIEDMMSNTKRYKEVYLAYIGRERAKAAFMVGNERDGRPVHYDSDGVANQQRSYRERVSAKNAKEKNQQEVRDEHSAFPAPKSLFSAAELQTQHYPKLFPAEDSTPSVGSRELSWSQDIKPPGSEYL